MGFIRDFLKQKAPKSGKEMPAYYRKALTASAVVLAIYFLACFLILGLFTHTWESMPLLVMAAVLFCLAGIDRIGSHINLTLYTAIMAVWCSWFVHVFGWSTGVQHFLIPLLIISFFNVYEAPWLKLAYCVVLIAFRMFLYAHALKHPPIIELDQASRIAVQCCNSVFLYVILSAQCILFSTNLQATERQLRIDNQELHKEAGTDPLTQLPNRRAMMDVITNSLKRHGDEPFGVAIADIDFFKSVNDTYGHNCGDYTLRTLSDKFRELAGDKYKVCRWGGEEFCFFMPGLNLDEAGAVMHDLCTAVKLMPLSFEGNDFSITITIGVAENDFHSPMERILEEADRKLYMGKNSGRDQVVI